MKKRQSVLSALFSARYGITLLFGMLIATTCHQASAQYTDFRDYTKMIEIKSQFSIDKHPVVRYINEKQRLVLNQRYNDCGGGSCFARYDDYTSNAEVLWLPQSWQISDFIINKDVVYFCGHTINKQAIVGYFHLSQFPNNQLHYFLLKEYVDFRTIELYIKDFTPTQRGELHLVMTTTRYDDGIETLVDCYREPGVSNVWHFEELNHHFDNGIHFVDLAVTNDFVLATSIENGMGYLWYFKRTPNPLFYDGHFSRNPVKCLTDYRLEVCGDFLFERNNYYYDGIDYTNPGTPASQGEFPFVTVATDCGGDIHVDCFNGTKHTNHLKSSVAALPFHPVPYSLYDLNTPYPLRDVSWTEVKDDDRIMRELDILYYAEDRDGAFSSHVIHIPHKMLDDTVGDIMNEMIFHKYSLWTLDNTIENVPFLAAGSWEPYSSPASLNTPLQLVKFTPGANQNCSDLRQVLFVAKPPIMKPEIRKTYPTHVKYEEELHRSGSDYRNIHDICIDEHPGVIINQIYYKDFHDYLYSNAEEDNITNRSMMTILNPSELSINPNPAKDQVVLECNAEMTQVDVINASGRQVLSEKTSGKSFSFNVSEWSQGLYVIIAYTADGMITKKLVVE